MNKIGVFSVSPLESNCLLQQSADILQDDDIKFNITYNNKNIGLSKFYNSIIETRKEFDILVFVHHDVSLMYTNLKHNLNAALNQYDVIGVAGARNPSVGEKNLWHWMTQKDQQRGFASHPVTFNNKTNINYVTVFGPSPDRVTILDGVFIALDARKVRGTRARFDENFMWHHYDIDFSLTCNHNHLKIGVWPILVHHESPGLFNINDTEWNRSNNYFISKWKK